MPEAETLVKKVEEADLNLDFATTDEEKNTEEEIKSGNTWRTLRLVSKTRLNRFDQLGDDSQLKKLLGDEQDRETQEHIDNPEQEQEQETRIDENPQVQPEPAEEAQSALEAQPLV
jgi:THO complex subunit 1